MNKKVSTLLTLGLVLGGSLLSSSAFAQDTPKALNLTTIAADSKDLKEWYYVGLQSGDYYLTEKPVTNTNSKEVFTSLQGVAKAGLAAEGDKALFQVKLIVVEGARYFELVNKASKKSVVFNATTTLDATTTDMIAEGDDFSSTAKYISAMVAKDFDATDGDRMIPFHGGATANTDELNLATTNVTLEASGVNLLFFSTEDNNNAGASAFADKKGEFTLEYKIDKVSPNVNDFQNVRAIDVTTGLGFKYTTGTYFVVNAPASLKASYNLSAGSTDETAKKLSKELDGLTFLAVSPSESWDFNDLKEVAEGMKFKTIRGSQLIENNKATKLNQTAVQNAVFTVSTNANKAGQVKLSVSPKVNDAEAEALSDGSKEVFVAPVKSQNKIYVSTVPTDGAAWTTVASSNVVAAKDFLKADAALVYNIKFVSTINATTEGDKTNSEYNKYLTIGYTSSSKQVVAQGADYVDLKAPQAQWIVSNATADNDIEFTNRETGDKFSAKLVKTANANEYKLTDVAETTTFYYATEVDGKKKYNTTTSNMEGTTVLLSAATVDKAAGYVSTELDNAGLVKLSFTVESPINPVKLYVTGEASNDALNQDETKAIKLDLVKFTTDTVYHFNDFAVWNAKDGVSEISEEVDTIAVNTYALKVFGAEKTYLNASLAKQVLAYEDDAQQFIIKTNANGSYTLIPYTAAADFTAEVVSASDAIVADLSDGSIDAATNIYEDFASYFTIEKEELGISLNHVPQHVTLKDANVGGYIAMGEEGNGIVAPVSELKASYTKEDLTFWLDTTDTDAHVPSFYITKGSKQFMFNAADSTVIYDNGTATEKPNEDFILPGTTKNPRAVFRAATLKDANTLVTSIEGKETELTVENGLNDYKFNIIENEDGNYLVRSVKDGSYLYNLNGQLGFADEKQAMSVIVETVEAPTSNEGVATSEVKVVANNGSINVKNAAGKNVVVSTILGQVVANEVLTSDNATINVPAGIVVVAVEGESFKVNVK